MRKIIIPTLLTLTASPLITITSCNNKPHEEMPSDTREWDYSNGYLCEARNYPVEGLEAQKHNTAITSYLNATKVNPKGFVDDLFLAENYNYLTYYGYLGSGLKKYKVKFTVSDIEPNYNTVSVHVTKDVKIQKGTGPEMDITVDLEINNLPYESHYSIKKETLTGAALPEWSFYPTYRQFKYEEFADKMIEINTDWSINGQILIESNGVAAQSLVYDHWTKNNIADNLTEQHYADLIDSYSGVPASYYFSYLPVEADKKFEWIVSDNVYKLILGHSEEERDEKVFVFKPNGDDNFEPGTYSLTLLEQGTDPIQSEYIVMDLDGNYLASPTSSQGQFPAALVLNKNSYLIFKISDVASKDKIVEFILRKN